MKRLIGALAAAALLVTPLTAMAQRGGGMHGGFGGGGMHGGAMMGGGGWHGGSMGAWRGGGWRGGRFRGGFCCGFFPWWGFGLGFAAAYPWYYWGDPGWGWGPGPYYGAYYGYDYGPPPVASQPVACGNWIWRTDQNRYIWQPGPCNAAPPPAAAPPAPAYTPPPAYNAPPAYAPAPRG